MWKRFGFEPYKEACAARLLPGDGIARRVMVQVFDDLDGRAAPNKIMPPAKDPEEREQRLELLTMDSGGFTARDPSNTLHACRWVEAVAYEKRHEC